MKRVFAIAVLIAMVASLIGCDKKEKLSSTLEFTASTDGKIITSSDGTEYELIAFEGMITSIGDSEFIGDVINDDEDELDNTDGIGMYTIEGVEDNSVLLRVIPDNEWSAYYRKSSLPSIELSFENCSHFELIKPRDNDIKHLNCGNGIKDEAQKKAFISEITSGKTAREAGLYDISKGENGILINCYQYAYVYAFLKDEPTLAIPMEITSFNDQAYSIRILYGDKTGEYVLPEKWLNILKENSCDI